MDPCDYNYCCVLVHCCLIVYEGIDKLVDMIVVSSYKGGNISDDPQDSVTIALFVFFIIGLLLTIQRMGMYCWRIFLYRADNNSLDESRRPTNLWFSFAKVWLEAFPQSTIAKFYFGNCAFKENTKTLVRAFDFFSLSPFIMFMYFTFHYYCTHEEGHYLITTLVLAVTFILSIVGIIFAGISMTDFNNSCRPYGY